MMYTIYNNRDAKSFFLIVYVEIRLKNACDHKNSYSIEFFLCLHGKCNTSLQVALWKHDHVYLILQSFQ